MTAGGRGATEGVRGARKPPGGPALLLSLASALASPVALACDRSRSDTEVSNGPSRDTVFKSEIRPILVAHCTPCHEPGGKLYAKLPFDDPAVLSSHEAGVKKRLKGDDLKAFERWLAIPKEKS
jgi:hypothetical protein